VGLGHVASLARPGGNVTGMATMQPDLATKRLAIFKEALPHATRFGVLWSERSDGVFVVQSSLMGRSHPGLLAELALKHRLPTIFGLRENVVTGGLMSYAPDHIDLTRRAATYIDKILKGAKPADLPVEQASKYQLVINLKTAKALGLAIPESFLLRADEVIE